MSKAREARFYTALVGYSMAVVCIALGCFVCDYTSSIYVVWWSVFIAICIAVTTYVGTAGVCDE